MEGAETALDIKKTPSQAGSINVGEVEVRTAAHEAAAAIDPVIERAVVRKLDFRLLTLLSVMYFFNSMDRSNLGSAKTDSLEEDLHLVGNQYTLALTLFNVTFCLFDLPSNLILKKVTGKYMLPTLMIGWGSTTLLNMAAYNFAGLLACRMFMGLFEAGFFAGTIFYLTQFYKRNEIALRLAIFYGMCTVSGAFTGLIAFGVFHIKSGALSGWRYLFMIEGLGTVVLASFAYWHLPLDAETCKWFTLAEKEVANRRILLDGSRQTHEQFNARDALRPLADWRIWVFALCCFSYGIASTSVSQFLPQMVEQFGYSTVKTNLYTVAPYCVGSVVLLVICRSSDYFRERGLHMAGSMLICLVGFAIYAFVDVNTHYQIGYFACFLMCAGAFTPSCIFHSWHMNNVAAEGQRAAVAGFLVGSANSGGVFSSLAFDERTAPRYLPGMILTTAFEIFGIALVVALSMWMRWDNRRRDAAMGVKLRPQDVPTELLQDGWKDPRWRWTT